MRIGVSGPARRCVERTFDSRASVRLPHLERRETGHSARLVTHPDDPAAIRVRDVEPGLGVAVRIDYWRRKAHFLHAVKRREPDLALVDVGDGGSTCYRRNGKSRGDDCEGEHPRTAREWAGSHDPTQTRPSA